MATPEGIYDAVAVENVKVGAGGPAFWGNQMMANAIANQQAMQAIMQASVGQIVKKLTEVDVGEAVSILKATTGNEVASAISALQAALASAQQGAKVAQTTPPPTA